MPIDDTQSGCRGAMLIGESLWSYRGLVTYGHSQHTVCRADLSQRIRKCRICFLPTALYDARHGEIKHGRG